MKPAPLLLAAFSCLALTQPGCQNGPRALRHELEQTRAELADLRKEIRTLRESAPDRIPDDSFQVTGDFFMAWSNQPAAPVAAQEILVFPREEFEQWFQKAAQTKDAEAAALKLKIEAKKLEIESLEKEVVAMKGHIQKESSNDTALKFKIGANKLEIEPLEKEVAAMKEHIQKESSDAIALKLKIGASKLEIEPLEKEMAAMKERLPKADSDATAAEPDKQKKLPPTPEAIRINSVDSPEMRKVGAELSESAEKLSKTKGELDALRHNLSVSDDVGCVTDIPYPKPLARTETDLKGVFSVTLKKEGSYVLVSHLRDYNNNWGDHHLWCLPITFDGNNKQQIALTNKNRAQWRYNNHGQLIYSENNR